MTLFREDLDLLRRFREGDQKALAAVYDAYVSYVAAIVSRGVLIKDVRLPPPPISAQDDLIQDVFVRAFSERARLGYDGLREYRPYLAQICRNVIIDWARKRGRELSVEELQQHLEEARAPETPFARVVVEFVATLDTTLKAVYEARYVQCLGQEESGALLGLSRQQLRTQEKRLREGLATRIKEGA